MKRLKLLLISLFILWFAISVGRIGFNYIKIYTQERNWLGKSDDEKKELLFGDVYPALQFIAQNTSSSSSIVILTPDSSIEPRLYYLSYYYLYPRSLILSKEKVKLISNYEVVYYKKNDAKTQTLVNLLGKNKKIKKFVGKNIQVSLIKNYE